jgi:hypothetical protein
VRQSCSKFGELHSVLFASIRREATMSWDAARRQVRNLETKLDAALNQYSRLAVNISGGQQAWPGGEVEEGRETENVALEGEIETALSEVCARWNYINPY